jgi:AcrR family transcriptional regulator
MVAPGMHAASPELVPLPGARAGRDPARAIKRGPSRVPPEVVAATQRDRLFDGLVHTVAQKGYANARVSDICQAAGVTRPAFYALFEGKDDAFLATYRHGNEMLLKLMSRAQQGAPDWRSGGREALRVLLDVLASTPAFAAMAVVEVEAAGPAARRERNKLLLRFAQFFVDAPEQADLPRQEELVLAVVGGIHASIYRYVAAGRVAELPSLLPMLSYFAAVPFIGQDEAMADAQVATEPGRKTVSPCAPSDGREFQMGDGITR